MEVNRYNIIISTDQANSSPLTQYGYPSTNSLTYLLDKPPLSLTKPNNYYTVEITNICMPFSFNGINSSNNKIIGNTMNISGTPYTFTLQITPGNYNIVQFCAELTTQLNNTYASFSSGMASFSCYVSSLITAQIIISCILGSESSLSLTLNFGYNSNSVGNAYMGDIIGFKNAITITPTSSATNNAYFNVNPISQIVLRSQSLSAYNFEFLGPQTQSGYGACNNSTIIGVFSVLTAPQSYLNSSNIIPLKTRIKNSQINLIDLTFYPDDSFTPIDFQGAVSNLTMVVIEYEPVVQFVDAIAPLLKSINNLNDNIMKLFSTKTQQNNELTPQQSGLPQNNETIPQQSGLPQNNEQTPEESNPDDLDNEEIIKNLTNALQELEALSI